MDKKATNQGDAILYAAQIAFDDDTLSDWRSVPSNKNITSYFTVKHKKIHKTNVTEIHQERQYYYSLDAKCDEDKRLGTERIFGEMDFNTKQENDLEMVSYPILPNRDDYENNKYLWLSTYILRRMNVLPKNLHCTNKMLHNQMMTFISFLLHFFSNVTVWDGYRQKAYTLFNDYFKIKGINTEYKYKTKKERETEWRYTLYSLSNKVMTHTDGIQKCIDYGDYLLFSMMTYQDTDIMSLLLKTRIPIKASTKNLQFQICCNGILDLRAKYNHENQGIVFVLDYLIINLHNQGSSQFGIMINGITDDSLGDKHFMEYLFEIQERDLIITDFRLLIEDTYYNFQESRAFPALIDLSKTKKKVRTVYKCPLSGIQHQIGRVFLPEEIILYEEYYEKFPFNHWRHNKAEDLTMNQLCAIYHPLKNNLNKKIFFIPNREKRNIPESLDCLQMCTLRPGSWISNIVHKWYCSILNKFMFQNEKFPAVVFDPERIATVHGRVQQMKKMINLHLQTLK